MPLAICESTRNEAMYSSAFLFVCLHLHLSLGWAAFKRARESEETSLKFTHLCIPHQAALYALCEMRITHAR